MPTSGKKHRINNETNESKTAKGIVKSVIKNELRSIIPILLLYLNTVTVTAGTFEP
jgi:hypothetical protein